MLTRRLLAALPLWVITACGLVHLGVPSCSNAIIVARNGVPVAATRKMPP